MEPITPPSLDEIQDIVSRRRRQADRRNQVVLTSAILLVAGGTGAGLWILATDEPSTGPAETAAVPTTADQPTTTSAEPTSTLTQATPTSVPPSSTTETTAANTTTVEETEPGADLIARIQPFDPDLGANFNTGLFYGAGYGIEQATALSQIWEIPQLDAKSKAGYLVEIEGGRELLVELVGRPTYSEAASFEGQRAVLADDLLSGAFFGGGFDLDQAIALSEAWDVTLNDAKVDGGFLVLTGSADEVEAIVGPPTFANESP